jgi:hypothetical protein
MKKISIPALPCKPLLTVLLLVAISLPSKAQTITNYTFANSTGTFTAITGGATTTWTGNTDDAVSDLIPLGFDFWYMGTRYTNLSASTNGWLALGTVQTDNAYTNNLTTGGAPRPVIAPLWDDLDIVSTANVTYKTTGTAGNRVFTLQYLNAKWYYLAIGSVVSFQISIYESTGKIQFIYRADAAAAVSPSASIGITATATGSGNFLSVTNAGTGVSSTTEASVTTRPATGKTYLFTPPVPTAPGSLTYTGISNTAMTLNWSDLSSNERGFVIYRSTDGANYTFLTQTAANTITYTATALSSNTTYYWKVYAVTEGALSSALSGSQATICTPPAAPTVTSPVNYCLNATATALTATGTNLVWSNGVSVSGIAGGASALTTSTYVDNTFNNKKTNFTTTADNVLISTVDYYLPAWQAANAIVIGLFNSSGTLLATSSTNTTLTAGATAVAVTNTFNYTIATAGDYSIGLVSGLGNMGSDNPTFPITETTGTLTLTGVSTSGARCYNNIKFASNAPTSTAPIPATTTVGSTIYQVTQTVGGCTSAAASITVHVTSPNISQVPTNNLIARYTFSGNAKDVTRNNNGTLQNAPGLTTDRFGVANGAYTFNGSSQYISTEKAYTNPTDFTISVWFKTNTTTGGKLIGFGREQTGSSGQYDRHLYMNNAGQVYFGVYSGVVYTTSSVLSYNDDQWHQATATLSATTGMTLYMDGVQVGANPATAGENYTGYWKIGYDNTNGWTSQPSSFYFAGTLDDVLIYHRALTTAEVITIYNAPDGAGNNGSACSGSPISLNATTLSGATYAWTGPNGFSSTQQNPSFSYTVANNGRYAVQVTAGGCTASAYTNVVSSTNAGQWTGSVSTDWANGANWCTGTVPTASTNVVIASTSTRMPTISGSVTCNNLTVNAGATLTLAAAGTLNTGGTLTNNGTMTNNGTINFNGVAGQQSFSGITTFYNLTLSNTNGLLLPAGVTVNNNLTITAGTLNTNDFNISVKGNWINNAAAGALNAGNGTVTFNGASAQTVGGSFTTTFNNLTIANTADVVTLQTSIVLSGNLSVSAGIFDIGAFTANRATSGGILTVANNATLKIGGSNTFPSNYATNTLVVASTVAYTGTNQTVTNQLYGNLTLSSSAGAAIKTFPGTALTIVGNFSSAMGAGTSVSFTAASPVTVNGNVSIGASTIFNGGSFSHNIGGNWINNGTYTGNTSTISFTGAGVTVSGTGNQNFNHLTVAASLVTFSAGTISVSGNLATSGAGSFSQTSGGTLVMTGTGTTITGSGISPDNLTVTGTVSTTAAINLTGHLSVSGSITTGAGSFTMSGTNKTISGAGVKNLSVLTITGSITTATDFTISSGLSVNGSLTATGGTAYFTGTSTLSGMANLFNVTINGTSLQLAANATLGIANALTLSAGTLNVSSTPNTVNFNGSGSQNINSITYYNLLLSGGGTKTATGSITTNSDLAIGAATTFNPSSYTHNIYGSWINNGIFLPGSSTVAFVGPATAYIKGATTFNVLTSNTSNATTELLLQSHTTAAIVNMTNGILLTGTDTLTITNTRTGNGIILGHIQRLHPFTAGVAYAFKSPYNTITFSSVAAVNNITVSVTEDKSDDFPFGGSINEEFNIAIPAGSYTASLSLDYDESALNGNNEATMTLWHYTGAVWVSVGKSTNSSTQNYVMQSGLTNMAGRWTLSDDANHVRWNGSVSTDWHTAANWTAISGSPSRPPTTSDIVDLGTATFNFQPTISAGASAKNIIFGSTKAVTLTLAAGGSLAVAGNIDGAWSANAAHAIQVNDQTLTVAGNMDLGDPVNGHKIDLTIGAGTVTVGASMVQTGGAAIVFTGSGTLNIQDDYEHENGLFTAGAGTVVYNGNGNQHIAHVNYNHLTINKPSGIAAIDSTVQVAGNLLVAAGQLDNTTLIAVAGNLTINTGATLNDNHLLNVGGNWTNAGTYLGSGALVTFNGTGTQTISATTFSSIVVNKPTGTVVQLADSIRIKGDLSVVSGTLDIKQYACNRDVVGGTATLGDSGTIVIGANNPPANFSGYALANSSTVVFNGTAPQVLLLQGIDFGNLTLRNTGRKTLVSPVTVNGNLTIDNGATFDADSNTITLQGNWTDNGTFVPSHSTVLCTGTSKNITGNTTFNKVTVTGSYTILNDVTFNDLLNITSTGSLSGGNTIHTTLHGDLINSGVLYTLGTTTYSGNRLQTLRLVNAVTTVAITVNFNGSVSPVLNSTSAPQFGFLNINNTGGVNPSVGWTVLYGLTIGNGASFNGGASIHNLMGAVTNNGTITSSGRLNFTPATAATVNLGTQFSSTGTVAFSGAGALTLAGTPGNLNNVIISNTNAAGITPSSAWVMGGILTINSGALLHAGNYTHQLGGNLMNNGTIDCGTSTFTLTGNGQQNLTTLSAFNNLRVQKPAGRATLFTNVTVNGVLQFVTGTIATGSNTLILPASGTVTGAAQLTGWVAGKLQKNTATGNTLQLFEVGDSANYTPVQVAFTNVTTAGNLTAYTTTYDHPQISSSTINASKSVNRYWTLTNNGVVFTSYNATFNFVATDLDPGTSSGAIVAGRYSDGAWTYPTIGAVTATSIQATGLTAFIDFQIGEMMIFVKTWDGGAGTRNWSDAANWNMDGVPTANDDVDLTRGDTIEIDINATTRHLLLNNPALVLTNLAGKSLHVFSDMTLVAGTFNTAAAFPTVTGTVNVAGGTVGFTGTGIQTIPAYNYNNLVSSSTGIRILDNSDAIGIAGTFTPGTNTFQVNGSTINYNGSQPQAIAPFRYHHLVLGQDGEKTFGNDTTGIAGILTITGNATTNTTANASTISYNGVTDQTVRAIAYYNLNAGNATGVVTLPALTITNNLSVSQGTAAIGMDAIPGAITVNGDISIGSGATLTVAVSSDATHLLTAGGNILNNGTLNLRPDANSLCNVLFNKNGSQLVAGAGISTRFNHITLNQGNANSNYLDVTAANFSAPDGFLTLNNGSFNLNSMGTTIVPFSNDITTGSYLIPATAGLWVNAGTIGSVNMNWTVAGLVKVTGGTMNMGSVADNVIIPKATASFAITGGNLNLASRISNTGIPWSFLMKGGTVTVNTQGSSAAGIAPFNMDAANSVFDMSGGTIVLQQAGGGSAAPAGYTNLTTGGPGFTGGTLQIGNAVTAAVQPMEIISMRPVYNLRLNSSAATAVLATTPLTVSNDVVITAGKLDIANQVLKIGGHLSNSDRFAAGQGTIEMNGTDAQTIPAGAFTGNLVKNLTINNPAGVRLDGTLALSAVLLAANGTLTTGGYLTLLSTATQTALIDGGGLGEVTGAVTMQRYLAAGFGYKYFSAPFQAATVNEFADDLNLGAAFPTFYRFDENQLSAGWVNYTNASGTLTPGTGYAANLGPSSAPVTVAITGEVNNHQVTLPALYNHNRIYTQGFNLIGNPYPSPIDWDAASGWNRTNVDNAVYYFNAGTTNQYTGTYSTYINGISSDGTAGNVIAAMQGFFVHVSNGSFPVTASISINNNARINNLVPDFRRRSPLTLPLLRLSAGFADEKMASDPAVLYFDDQEATTAFDREMDALKIMNTDSLVPNLYMIGSDTSRLSICAWPGLPEGTDRIPLGLQTKRAGWITFYASAIERIPAGKRIYLYDAKTGISQDLELNPRYRQYLEAGDYKNRFFLAFAPQNASAAPTTTNNVQVTVYQTDSRLYARLLDVPGDKCAVTVSNLQGQVLLRKQLAGNGQYELGSFINGVYIVSFFTQQQVFSKKIFVGQ